jgi:hypothetical protein
MVAYNASVYSKLTDEEKKERINEYDTADLLKIIRAFEESQRDYSPEIIKLVSSKLYEKGIMLMY